MTDFSYVPENNVGYQVQFYKDGLWHVFTRKDDKGNPVCTFREYRHARIEATQISEIKYNPPISTRIIRVELMEEWN